MFGNTFIRLPNVQLDLASMLAAIAYFLWQRNLTIWDFTVNLECKRLEVREAFQKCGASFACLAVIVSTRVRKCELQTAQHWRLALVKRR